MMDLIQLIKAAFRLLFGSDDQRRRLETDKLRQQRAELVLLNQALEEKAASMAARRSEIEDDNTLKADLSNELYLTRQQIAANTAEINRLAVVQSVGYHLEQSDEARRQARSMPDIGKLEDAVEDAQARNEESQEALAVSRELQKVLSESPSLAGLHTKGFLGMDRSGRKQEPARFVQAD